MKKITEKMDVFTLKIQTLYDIEKELEKVLPKLAKAASDSELSENLLAHLDETKKQGERLEKIFDIIGENPSKSKCEAIRAIAEDGAEIIKSNTSTQLKDTMIASAGRETEHLEIANYMSAILEAKQLGLSEVSELLSETLQEEKLADERLEKAMKKNFQEEVLV